jgi:serine/threonine protein kinase
VAITDLVKLVDFGIAKLIEDDAPLTVAGTVLGTLSYMAPEQAVGSTIDARTDVYAVAGCMYFAFTGHKPMEGLTGPALMTAIILQDPPPMQTHRSEVDPGFARIVTRGLRKNPDDRFASATEMGEAIAAWVEGRETEAAPSTVRLPTAAQPVPPAHPVHAHPAQPAHAHPAHLAPMPMPTRTHGPPQQHPPPWHWSPPLPKRMTSNEETIQVLVYIFGSFSICLVLFGIYLTYCVPPQ